MQFFPYILLSNTNIMIIWNKEHKSFVVILGWNSNIIYSVVKVSTNTNNMWSKKKKHEDDDVSSKIQINVYYITNIKDKVAKINK